MKTKNWSHIGTSGVWGEICARTLTSSDGAAMTLLVSQDGSASDDEVRALLTERYSYPGDGDTWRIVGHWTSTPTEGHALDAMTARWVRVLPAVNKGLAVRLGDAVRLASVMTQ